MALPHCLLCPWPLRAWQQWLWALLIVAPSAPVMLRILGNPLAGAACVAGLSAIFVAQRFGSDLPAAMQASRDPRVVIIAAMLVGMVVAFAVLFPQLNSQMPGQGSDRDDALNVAIAAMFRGEYPYAQTTYLGNPITPLPGALLLAIPFWSLGNAALQAVAWLAVWSAALLAVRRTWLTVLAIAASALSP